MSLRDHAVSFGVGVVIGAGAGGIAAGGVALASSTAALTASPAAVNAVKDVEFKRPAFFAGALTGATGTLALAYSLATDPQTSPAAPEQTTPAIEQQKPAPCLSEGATVYQSTSGPVTVPKGLKVG